jgi:SAM-dependent methyltransferase
MQAYGDSFAHIYNLRWGFFAERIAPKILSFYVNTNMGKSSKEVLDLCCGTGHLALILLQKGYRVTGLDLSPAMLEIAKEKNIEYIEQRQARFIEADAADFSLDQKFGLVVSTFDALNHLESFEALLSCFECVYDVTKDGGWFIFDLNTKLGLRRWSGAHFDNDDEELIIFTRGIFDEINEVAYTQISGFLRTESGLYERFDETVYNSIFNLAAVKDGLVDVGWKDIQFAHIDNLENPVQDPEELGRVFVLAQK